MTGRGVRKKLTKAPKKKFWNTAPAIKKDLTKFRVGIDQLGDSGFSVSGTVPFSELSEDARSLLLIARDRLEIMNKGGNLKTFDAAAVAARGLEVDVAAKKSKDETKLVKEAKQFDAKMLKWLERIGRENG